MLRAIKDKGLLWPSIMTVVGVIILIGLGNWQMQRLAWKQGLIGAIAERTRAVPVDLTEIEWRAGEGGDIEYARVEAKGRLRNDRELHLYAFDARHGPGYHVITPLERADGSIVLVNRGYVPQALKEAAKRAGGQPEDGVEIVGLVRRPETAGTFTPANDAPANIWYWRDLDAMVPAALGPDHPKVLPFFIDAEAGTTPPGGWPKGGVTRLELPNRHFEYALTWYGLALALVGVFAAFAATRWRHSVR